jgi:ATP-dependent protease ClpP protease subunit
MSLFHRGKTRLETVNRALARAEMDIRVSARPWYAIRNAAGTDGQAAELSIYDEVGFWGVTAAQFAQDLASITAPELTVRVSSPGGDVFDAVAIYNMIRAHPSYVTAKVDGLAASAASVIVQAADSRVMMPHSQMMIHDAWGMAVGNAATMREAADMLDKQSAIIADIYHERVRGGSRSLAKIRAAMADETWYVDEAAVKAGLADSVERPGWKDGPGPAEDPPVEDAAEPDMPPKKKKMPMDEVGDGGGDDGDVEDAMATLRAELAKLDEVDDLEDLLS